MLRKELYQDLEPRVSKYLALMSKSHLKVEKTYVYDLLTQPNVYYHNYSF